MNRTLIAVTLALAGAAGSLRADPVTDVNMVVINGQLFTVGGTYATGPYAGRVFYETLSGTSSTNPGFYAELGTFPNYSATPPLVGLRMDFVKELLFWNGTQLAQPNSTLTVRRSTRSATISGTNTAGRPGILIENIPSDGSYHVHPTFSVQNTAANGIYGIVLTLGPNNNGADAGFTTSDPILIALRRGTVANINQGLAALTQAAFVPEPASLAMAGTGAFALVGAALLRRRRRTSQALAAVAVLAFMGLAVTPARAEVWTLGHGDIGVAYHPDESTSEFEMEVHLKAGAVVSGSTVTDPAGVVFAPGDVTIRVPLSANLKAIQSGSTAVWGGDAAGYDFIATGSTLGVAPGGNLWMLSYSQFDTSFYQTPFVGWAAEEGFDGQGFSDVVFRPTSFTGPSGGSFGVFNDALEPLWVILAGDTTFAGDEFAVPAGDHVHNVLAFTQPGIYSIGIEAAAMHPTHGPVSGVATYTFQVVPEPATWVLAAGAAVGVITHRGPRRLMHRAARRPTDPVVVAGQILT